MKADEYIKKHEICSKKYTREQIHEILVDISRDLLKEIDELLKIRHVSFDRGLISILKELNQKANKIAKIIEEHQDYYPSKDWWKFITENIVPESKGMW